MEKAVVRLKKGSGRSLKGGGAWVYDNEIDRVSGSFCNGDLVFVEDFDGYFLGTGFINEHSTIRVRIMSRVKGQEINEAFIEQRVRAAIQYRVEIGRAEGDIESCRLIFGEADFLPGIVVDKFAEIGRAHV